MGADANLYKLAESHFISPLLEKFNISGDCFYACQGNHENDIEKHNEFTLEGLKSKAKDIAELEKIFNLGNIFNSINSSNFKSFIEKRNINVNFISDIVYYSKTNIENCAIGIVGINTGWSSCGSSIKDSGQLFYGYTEIEKGLNEINDCKLKIMLMHHPLDYCNVIEKKNCDKILQRFSLVLSGHLHDLDDKQIVSPIGNTLFLSAGRLDSKNIELNGYSLLEFNPVTMSVTVHFRKYYENRDCFDKSLQNAEDGVFVHTLSDIQDNYSFVWNLVCDMNPYYERFLQDNLITNILKKENATQLLPLQLYNYSEFTQACDLDSDCEKTIIDLNVIMQNSDNYKIFGRQRFGKTTLLKFLAQKYVSEFIIYNRFPFYVDMKTVDFAGKNQLFRAIKKHLSNISHNSISLKDVNLTELLMSGCAVLLVDNFNSSDSMQKKIIDSFINQYKNTKLIITENEEISDFLDIKKSSKLPDEYFKRLYIHSISKDLIGAFAEFWIDENIDDVNNIVNKCSICISEIGMEKTPFNAIMVLAIYNDAPNFFAINEANVIERFMELLLEKLDVSEFKSSSFDFRNKEDFLANMALHMFNEDKYSISEEEFDAFSKKYFNEFGLDRKNSNFDKIFFEKQVLTNYGGKINFTYRFVLEYYIAKAFSIWGVPEKVMQDDNYLSFANELNYYSGIIRKDNDIFRVVEKNIDSYIDKYSDKISQISSYKFDIEIEYSIPNEKFSNKELNIITDRPDSSISISSKKDIAGALNNDKTRFYLLLNIYSKMIRNIEYLNATEKINAINNCIRDCTLILSLMIEIIDTVAHDDINELKEALQKKLSFNKSENELDMDELLSQLFEVIKISIPSTIEVEMFEWLGSRKLLPQFKQIAAQCDFSGITDFFFLALFLDFRDNSGYLYASQYIKRTDDKSLLNLLFAKLTTSYLLSNSNDDDKLEELMVQLSKKQKFRTNHNQIRYLDKEKLIKHIRSEKGKIQKKLREMRN